MHVHFDEIIQPILTLLNPETIVEIGSETGVSTTQLLQFCRQYKAVLHAIDPVPLFDPMALQREYQRHFVFHQALSLNALPNIAASDVALIDGDHNWYTVFNELKLIERQSLQTEHPFPFVLLHDVGWPYGRRDLYYNPDTIPAEFRQPYAKKGMHPGVTHLIEHGGKNSWLCNAIEENTPRNGVLTAIEDFLNDTHYNLELLIIPGLHDLALLYRTELKLQNFPLAQFLDVWSLHPVVKQYMEKLEAVRVASDVLMGDQKLAFSQTEAGQQQQLIQLGSKIELIQTDLTTKLMTLSAELESTRAELAACRAQPGR